MVEQSIISAPLATEATISVQTDSTCLPAGSMVITTSASLTASAALAAIATPSAFAVSSDAGTRSKPRTLWPALTRLAAIGPPMLPRPMNAMLVMILPSRFGFEYKLIVTAWRKVSRNHLWRHVFDPRRRPFRIAVLVDHRRPDTFREVVIDED